jgi:hypothetical protein
VYGGGVFFFLPGELTMTNWPVSTECILFVTRQQVSICFERRENDEENYNSCKVRVQNSTKIIIIQKELQYYDLQQLLGF